jgi:hypothetical protein
MLKRLVRLADVMALEMLLGVVLAGCEDVCHFVTCPPKKNGLFMVTLNFGPSVDTPVSFTPDSEYLRVMLARVHDAMLAAAANLQRLLFSSALRPFLVEPDPPSPERVPSPNARRHAAPRSSAAAVPATPRLATLGAREMVAMSARYAETQKRLQLAVESDWEAAAEYGLLFAPYYKLYLHCLNFERDRASLAATDGADGERSVRELQAEMMLLSRSIRETETNMKVINVTGSLHLDSKNLRSSLLLMLNECFDSLKETMQIAARTTCVTLIQQFQAKIKGLQANPRNLREYTAFVESVQRTDLESRKLFAVSSSVDEMYRMLQQLQIRIPTAEQVKWEDLHRLHDLFVESMRVAEIEVESRMHANAAQLEKNLMALDEECHVLVEHLSSGPLVQAGTEPSEAQQLLTTIEEALSGVHQKAEQYTSWCRLFRLADPPQAQLTRATTLFDTRRELWTAKSEWAELTDRWLWSTEFVQLNVEHDVVPEIAKHYQLAYSMWKDSKVLLGAEDDAIAKAYKTAVQPWAIDFKATLLELGRAALRPRHWVQILKLVGSTADYMMLKLQNLFDLGLFDHKEEISEIARVASGEMVLEEAMQKLDSTWTATDFVVRMFRGTRDVFILSDTDEIVVLLEDSHLSVQAMLSSHFISGMQSEVHQWDARLSSAQATLEAWLGLQQQWVRLPPSPPSAVRWVSTAVFPCVSVRSVRPFACAR